MKYKVEVTRESWASATFEVEAQNEEEAQNKAIAQARSHEFGSSNTQYDIADVTKQGE